MRKKEGIVISECQLNTSQTNNILKFLKIDNGDNGYIVHDYKDLMAFYWHKFELLIDILWKNYNITCISANNELNYGNIQKIN